jgi:hypothetical protein
VWREWTEWIESGTCRVHVLGSEQTVTTHCGQSRTFIIIVYSLSIHCPFTLFTVPTLNCAVTCPLIIDCLRTVYSLSTHCPFTTVFAVYSQFIHCAFILFTVLPSSFNIHTVYSLSIHCLITVCTLYALCSHCLERSIRRLFTFCVYSYAVDRPGDAECAGRRTVHVQRIDSQ